MILKRCSLFLFNFKTILVLVFVLFIMFSVSLYNAMQNYRIMVFSNDFIEVSKALDSFFQDTKNNLILDSDISFNIVDLIEDAGLKGWNGPYLNAEIVNNSSFKLNNMIGDVEYSIYKCDDNWNSGVLKAKCNVCSNNENCSIYIRTDGLHSHTQGFAKKVDEFIDGYFLEEDGVLKIEYQDEFKSDNLRIFYKVMSYNNFTNI